MKNKKISYILPTNRPLSLSSPAIKAVLELPSHAFELIIACPKSAMTEEIVLASQGMPIKLVEDKTCTGACNPTNAAYKVSDGDYISIMSDDITYPPNFLDVVEWMEGEEVRQKEFKIVNMLWDGGPGLITYGHDAVADGQSLWWPPPDPLLPQECYPYSVICMSMMARETIEKHFNGHIYHPDFRQHYGDHWIGFYACKNEVYKPFSWRCPTIKYQVVHSMSSMNSRHDAEDILTFRRLASEWMRTRRPYV